MGIDVSDSSMAMIAQLVYLDATSKENVDSYRRGELTVSKLLNSGNNKSQFNGFTEAQIKKFEEECGNWRITNEMNSNESNECGLYGFIVEPEPGKGIVAFRGSEPFADNLNDWRNNCTLLDEVQTVQHKEIEKYIAMGIFDEYTELAVTGHSLGGNNANYFTTGTDINIREKIVSCLSFNAPGFNSEYKEKYKEKIEQMSHLMKNFQNEKDIVSSILYNLTTPIIIETAGKEGGYISNHSIYQFIFNDDGTLRIKNNQQKDLWCNMINTVTIELERIPGNLTGNIIEAAFNVFEGSGSFKDYLTVGSSAIMAGLNGDKIASAILMLGVVESVKLLTTNVKNFVIQSVDKATEYLKNKYNQFIYTIDKFIVDSIKSGKVLSQKISETFIKVKNGFKNIQSVILSKIKGINKFAKSSSGIIFEGINLRTEDLNAAMTKLNNVQRRISIVDNKLSALRRNANLDDKLKIALIDLKVGQKDYDITKIILYLDKAINELSKCERQVLQWARSI